MRTLARGAGVPPGNRAHVVKEWNAGIDLYRVRILRIEKENPLRPSETARRVADSLLAAYRAIDAMPPPERLKFEVYIREITEVLPRQTL